MADYLPVIPPKENLQTVIGSNTIGGYVEGEETVPIDSLSGGISTSKRAQDTVKDIAAQMSSPSGYIERLIVDQDGNVIEGAHRLEALRKIGIEEIPVTRIVDPTSSLDLVSMRKAMEKEGKIHPDHVNQIMSEIGNMLRETDNDPGKVLTDYIFPAGYEKYFKAALTSLEPDEPRSTALATLAVPPEEDRPKDPTKKQAKTKTGIGGLMKKGFWPLHIIRALQQGWDTLSDEQKTEITEFMNKPMHELVGLPPPPDLGIGSYLRDLLGMASEEEITESRIQARGSYDELMGTEPEGGIATLEQSKEARESYDELMGITQNFEPTYENMPGEWFLVEGQAEYAEGDIGEYNHEAIVRRNVLYKLADAANDFLDADINLDDEYIDETTLEYILAEQVEGASDPQAVMDKMGITQKEVDVAFGRGNATDYGIEELGYVRVAGNNVELSGLTGSKMREIADGLYDAGGESVEGMTFNIEDSATTKFYKDVPFPVLSSGRVKALRDYDTSIVGMEEGGLVETSELIPELVSKAHGGFIDKPLYSRS